MPSDIDQLRAELRGKLRPPIEVMLDPSLLVAETTRRRLADSALFDAQATLGGSPNRPRVDSLSVPRSFRALLDASGRTSRTSSVPSAIYTLEDIPIESRMTTQ